MGWQWPWVRKMRQPWLFVYYAVAFGGLTYLLQNRGVFWSVWGGLTFAVLMSLWRELRKRRTGSRNSA
jgi:hypothetical protein